MHTSRVIIVHVASGLSPLDTVSLAIAGVAAMAAWVAALSSRRTEKLSAELLTQAQLQLVQGRQIYEHSHQVDLYEHVLIEFDDLVRRIAPEADDGALVLAHYQDPAWCQAHLRAAEADLNRLANRLSVFGGMEPGRAAVASFRQAIEDFHERLGCGEVTHESYEHGREVLDKTIQEIYANLSLGLAALLEPEADE